MHINLTLDVVDTGIVVDALQATKGKFSEIDEVRVISILRDIAHQIEISEE